MVLLLVVLVTLENKVNFEPDLFKSVQSGWVPSRVGVWQKIVGPKLLKLRNYRFQKISAHKNFGFWKIWGHESWKISGHEKFWVMKNFGSWKIIDHEKSPVKFLVQKNIMSDKIFDPKKSWILKNFGTQNFLSFKNFELQKILSCKNILDQKKFRSE